MTLDTSGLTQGTSYNLCVDIDGTGATNSMEDTTLDFYVAGATAVTPQTAPCSTAQLQVTCTICTDASTGYLQASSATCTGDGTVAQGDQNTASGALVDTDSVWVLTLDTAHLTIGSSYGLCLDIDGPGTDHTMQRT